jgi:hypothetical protein
VTVHAVTQRVRFSDVAREVRRYRPSDLLPQVAALATQISGPEQRDGWRELAPWSLAAIARESLLGGNEHRQPRTIAEVDVRRLNAFFVASYDGPVPDPIVLRIFTTVAYEQFAWQESDKEELLRSVVLFKHVWPRAAGVTLPAERLTEAFSAPVLEVVDAGLTLYAITNEAQGRLAPEFLEPDLLDDARAAGALPVASNEAVRQLATELTADQDQMRADFRRAYPNGAPVGAQARYAYNPLARYPLARLVNGDVVAPQPRLLLRRVSPGGLYYVGQQAFGNAFTTSFGYVVEAYVGECLSLVDGAEVHPEIVYTTRNGEAKSVDWIVVLPTAVLLVEAKAARALLGPRSGSESMVVDLAARLDAAAGQINVTADKITERHAAFAHLPTDRPLIGVVVTAEPFYSANSSDLRAALHQSTERTTFASLRDLERLVLYPAAELGAALVDITADADLRHWLLPAALRNRLGDPPAVETQLLTAAADELFPGERP